MSKVTVKCLPGQNVTFKGTEYTDEAEFSVPSKVYADSLVDRGLVSVVKKSGGVTVQPRPVAPKASDDEAATPNEEQE